MSNVKNPEHELLDEWTNWILVRMAKDEKVRISQIRNGLYQYGLALMENAKQ